MVREAALIGAALILAGCAPEWQTRAEDAVRQKLDDPYSAKFDSIEKCKPAGLVSGSVNAKNGFGAYVGSTPFIVKGLSVYFPDTVGPFPDEPLEEQFFYRLRRYCLGTGPAITIQSYAAEHGA